MKFYLLFVTCVILSANIFAQSGAVDASFGAGGYLLTTVNNSGMGNAVAVQPDGKILFAGTANFMGGTAFVLGRYTTSGSLDASFGITGVLITRVTQQSGANCILIQPDGKIITAGKSLNESGNYDFTLVRHTADGTIDNTFGAQGIVITDLGRDDEVTSINLQPDGKIVAAGISKTGNTVFQAAVVRYNTDGSVDNNFGTAGMVTAAIHLSTTDKAPLQKPDCKLQADGKIVLVTTAYNQTNDMLVLRFDTDGTTDNNFGAKGEVAVDFGGNDDFGYAAAIQPDGKIIVGGGSVNSGTNQGYMALARLNTTGSLDNTFGTAGLLMDISSQQGLTDVRSILLQSDSNIIAAGNDSNPKQQAMQGFIVAKYLPNGILNASFGTGGYTIAALDTTDAIGNSVAMQPDGKLVMAGGSGEDFILTRFLNDAPTTAISDAVLKNMDLQVYPNPSSQSVTLNYTLTENENVTLRLWNMEGQIVNNLLDGVPMPAGNQTEQINISALPSGYYMLNLVTPGAQATMKLMKE